MDISFNTNQLIIAMSTGISLFFITYFIFVFKVIQKNRNKFSLQLVGGALDKNRRIRNLKRAINKYIKKLSNLTKKEKYLILVIILLTVGISKSIKVLHINLVLGLVVGLFAIRFVEKVKDNMTNTKKLKEVVILFEGVEMYSKAGYSLVQSLRASKILTKAITPSIDKCLSYWSMGPQKALEVLKDELNLEETESLILLMMHLESAGAKNLQGILQREAHNIDRLQRMKVELKIAHRPLILLVYKVLPIAAILGIIIGSLIYRMFFTLNGMGIL